LSAIFFDLQAILIRMQKVSRRSSGRRHGLSGVSISREAATHRSPAQASDLCLPPKAAEDL
jgi:hypothetical protein